MGEIWRSGVTSNYVYQETSEQTIKGRKLNRPVRPEVQTSTPHNNDDRDGIAITATIASKGGGRTYIKCWFGTDDFRKIAEAMVRADPSAAKTAFESAIENPNKTDEEIRRKFLECGLAKLK